MDADEQPRREHRDRADEADDGSPAPSERAAIARFDEPKPKGAQSGQPHEKDDDPTDLDRDEPIEALGDLDPRADAQLGPLADANDEVESGLEPRDDAKANTDGESHGDRGARSSVAPAAQIRCLRSLGARVHAVTLGAAVTIVDGASVVRDGLPPRRAAPELEIRSAQA